MASTFSRRSILSAFAGAAALLTAGAAAAQTPDDINHRYGTFLGCANDAYTATVSANDPKRFAPALDERCGQAGFSMTEPYYVSARDVAIKAYVATAPTNGSTTAFNAAMIHGAVAAGVYKPQGFELQDKAPVRPAGFSLD